MKWLYVSIQYFRGESKVKGFCMEYTVKWYSKKLDQENRHWIAVHAILTFVAYLIIAWYTFHIFCCWYCWVGNVNTVIDIYFPSKKRSKMVETEKKPCQFWSDFFHVWQFYDKSIFFLFETLRFDKLWHYRMNSKQGNF